MAAGSGHEGCLVLLVKKGAKLDIQDNVSEGGRGGMREKGWEGGVRCGCDVIMMTSLLCVTGLQNPHPTHDLTPPPTHTHTHTHTHTP